MTRYAALASAALLAASLAVVAPAAAKVKINLIIGIPDIGVIVDDRISCYQGKLIVRHNGFRDVIPRDCSGQNYHYTGRRNGKRFVIKINSYTADIVNVSRF